jgi:hypothetical protein
MRAEQTTALMQPSSIGSERVKHIEPGLGIGIEFKDVAETDQKRLELLVASLAEKYSTRTRYASGQF